MAFLMQFMTVLSTITVSWFNTIIDIPLGGDIETYAKIPEAVIYVDGIAQDDIPHIQTDGVNRTFLSVVNTNVVKTYRVYFEAYFETYDEYSEIEITFNIVDDIDPEFDYIPIFILEVGSDPPDYEEGLYYSDNYDSSEDLIMSYNANGVLCDVVGDYLISYTIMDTSLNSVTETSVVHIVDTTKPIIIQKELFLIELGKTFVLSDYFKVDDNYDAFIEPKIDVSNVDFNVAGDYSVTISAVDQNDNLSTYETTLIIINVSEPSIILQSNPTPIRVNDQDALNKLSDYIISVSDGDKTLSIEDVVITNNIQIDRVGTYEINYLVSNNTGFEVTKTLEIDVIDDIAPTIICEEDLKFPVFGPELFLETYFIITDNYDDVIDIEIDTDIDYDKTGLYPIVVMAEDESGNQSTYYNYVEIIDVTPPSIVQLNDIVITNFMAHVIDSYFDLSDNYDEKVSLTIDIIDENVDYHTIGIYPITVIVSDTSGLTSSLETELFIVDVTPPVLELTKYEITIPVGDVMQELTSFINSISDNYDQLSLEDVVIEGHVDTNVVGVYDICYQVKDSSGNEDEKTLTIYVDDFIAPIMTMSNVIINQYEDINLLMGIVVKEENSTYQIMYFPTYVDTSVPGEQVVTYICQDARGNYSIEERIIIINAVIQPYELENFIPMIVVVLTGGIIMIAIKKRG